MRVEITDRTFTAAHPNPEHIEGVLYDPAQRCVWVDTPEGGKRAGIGDWIIARNGGLYVSHAYSKVEFAYLGGPFDRIVER